MQTERTNARQGLTLFLVDKDDINLLAHRKIAEGLGFFNSIRSATDGLRAFDLINLAGEGKIPFPDIVLFDLDLPILNGITLLKVLHKADIPGKKNICFVVLSSPLSEEEEEAARSFGVSAFLSRPLSAGSLESVVKSAYAAARGVRIPAFTVDK